MLTMEHSKGVSPLIAAVLLIAFTLSVAGLFSSWVPDLLQGLQSGTGEDASDLLESSRAGLSVDSAVVDRGSGNTSVVFRNSGEVELGNFTVTARVGEDYVQRGVDSVLDTNDIVSVELNTSSSPDLVRVDSEELDVSAETRSVSSVGGSVPASLDQLEVNVD